MNDVKYFTDLFESKPDLKKIALLMFLFKSDVNFSYECGFLKSDINFLYEEFKKILLELNEECLKYNENDEESFWKNF